MKRSHTFDVAIIGRGITGTSAAWHLSKQGYRNILLVGPERALEQCSSMCPGFVTPATIDNITRIAHGHGDDLAAALLQLGSDGYLALQRFANEQKIPWITGAVRRFAPTEHEKNEMRLATEILNKLGFAATLAGSDSENHPMGVIAVQRDGLPAASTESALLLDTLEANSQVTIKSDPIQSLSADKNYVQLVSSHETFAAEMTIVAAHLNTGILVPNLRDSLVSFADQWISFNVAETTVPIKAGDIWIGHHGHYGVWRSYNQKVFMSGARFLRHWAGIEAKTADVRDDITAHLLKKGEEWFGFRGITNLETHGVLDCRPCDELPIIGPMFGQSRILVGAGYMGAGLALGFAAGRALAEIVDKGKTSLLHPGFTPERLRSLSM